MRKLINLVLLAVLATGAYLSRPDQKQFAEYLVQKATAGDSNVLRGTWDEAAARDYADKCSYTNSVFWTTVRHNDETIYVGAFSHWFNKAEIKHDLGTVQQKASDELNQLGKTKDQLEAAKNAYNNNSSH